MTDFDALRFRLAALDTALTLSPLRLAPTGLGAPGGWFLGPKSENKDLLLALITDTIEEHCGFRTSYHPEDPAIITAAVKQTPEYIAAVNELSKSAAALNATLRRSAPIFSMRSHGHMLWDQVLPAMVGYFAGMLYNQNNVAAEASPVTTWLEIQVGNDLCRMLGYDVPLGDEKPAAGVIVPWGHITCGGTVANIEALWAARNAKFNALALQAAIKEAPSLSSARDVEVPLLNGSMARLRELDPWTLLNLPIDTVLSLSDRMVQADGTHTLEPKLIAGALRPFSLQNIGIVEILRTVPGRAARRRRLPSFRQPAITPGPRPPLCSEWARTTFRRSMWTFAPGCASPILPRSCATAISGASRSLRS